MQVFPAVPSPLRVLAVTNMYPTPRDPVYGAFVWSQMESIRELGVDVNVQFVDGRRSVWRYAAAAATLPRVATRKRYDLVHAHYGLTGFVALVCSLPLVVSFCGDDLLGTPNGRGGLTTKSRVVRRLSQIAAGHADAIICKSEELRASLPTQQERDRAHVIPNGVDTDRFKPGDRLNARRELGIDPAERLVLFPNTPTERRKRLDLAEAAVEALNKLGMAARLWVVSQVPPERMPLHYQAVDCLLLTSDWEGSPNVVKEALCCDLPVVSVNVGDVAGWLERAPGCHLVERAPQAIADGLLAVLGGRGRINGARVRGAVGARAIANRVLSVYEEAIDVRGRGA